MKHFLFFLLLLLGACEPALESDRFGDEDPMARTLENKPVNKHVSELPAVVPVTPSNGSWSGNNQLGTETKFAPDSNNRQTVLKLDEWGPPEIWTVSLYIRDDLQTFNGLDIAAIVEFGAGGSTQTIELDWSNGTQISLPMNAVNVIAVVRSVTAFNSEGPGLHLGVQLSRGRRGGSIPPRFTIASAVVMPIAGIQTFQIPNFAKNVVLIADDLGSTSKLYNVGVDVAANTGLPSGGTDVAVLDGTQLLSGNKLPVIGGARSVIVTNGSGASFTYSIYAELDG